MGYKEDYKDLREVFLKYKRKDYFETYSSADLFYVIGSLGDYAILTFIDQFFGEAKGLQCFFNRDGMNYVHDILSTNDEYSVTVGDCDSIVAVFKTRDMLTDEDIEFLNKMDKRKTKDNNLIIYRFKKGYRYTIASHKDIHTIATYGVFLDSLIENEREDINNAFKDNDCVIASLNHEKKEYSCIYRPLPYLEDMPNRAPINKQFVEEYENHVYLNEECYIFTSYLPVAVKSTGVRPLLLYFYYAGSNRMELRYILSSPKEYKNIIYGILDEIFTKIGLPYKMIINNRDLYTILTKTLDRLSIENVFERDNLKAGEDVSNLVSSVYQKTQDTLMEEEEIKEMFDFLIKAIGTLEDNYTEEDIASENSFVS